MRKYQGARVPRYTSYPTAPHFSRDIGAETLSAWLADLPPGAGLSLYLHVPFCQKMCWYCGCNMRLVARYDPVKTYVDRLIAEIHQKADALGRRHTLTHIHWGGGTPTTLSPADFARVDAAIRERFDIADGAEIAVEIDPRTLDRDTVAALARMGCNRASLGVQEFDPQVQRAINRLQPFETVKQVCAWLHEAGITSLNFDLMYGLPLQTPAMLSETVKRAVALDPARLAVFGYAHVPWMAKNQRKIDEDALPGAEMRFEMAGQARALLKASGYQAIGIDHFARPDDELARAARDGRLRRNFQGYTTDGADALIGLGASAISALPQGYVQNVVQTNDYLRAIDAGRMPVAKGLVLSDEDIWRRAVIERLMCDFAVDLEAIALRFGLSREDFAEDFERLRPLEADGLVRRDGAQVHITAEGRPLARVVAAAFDVYLGIDSTERRHATV
ncbi:MAG: oxygen-independent coproporphyrinogen III oxidase [Dichotomicrobium sp.]